MHFCKYFYNERLLVSTKNEEPAFGISKTKGLAFTGNSIDILHNGPSCNASYTDWNELLNGWKCQLTIWSPEFLVRIDKQAPLLYNRMIQKHLLVLQLILKNQIWQCFRPNSHELETQLAAMPIVNCRDGAW